MLSFTREREKGTKNQRRSAAIWDLASAAGPTLGTGSGWSARPEGCRAVVCVGARAVRLSAIAHRNNHSVTDPQPTAADFTVTLPPV
jgi:hypothetical protein